MCFHGPERVREDFIVRKGGREFYSRKNLGKLFEKGKKGSD